MNLLFVTPECGPWVKTGGLGDVAAALPPALAALGHDVRVLMPAYRGMAAVADLMATATADATFEVADTALWPAARLLSLPQPAGTTMLLLDCPELFAHDGGPYVDAGGADHADNARRFAFLSHVAALLGTRHSPLPDWRADVVHGHDWTCGLAPLFLADARERDEAGVAASVITIHNLAFQGMFPLAQAAALGVAPRWLTVDGAEFWNLLSMLKAGLQCADAITTVSPTYALEIQTQAQGCALDGVMRGQSHKLSGILNGIDTALWNPATDPLIAARYDAGNLQGKAECKRALQRRCGLPEDAGALLFGLVSRLTPQKGVDLIAGALPWLRANGCQLAVLGKGDAELERLFAEAAAAHPQHISVTLGFDESLAHGIEAGADCFLMPSRYEPCGLNQMYSQRYGTPPLVHATGGLVDSVTDVSQPGGTGFVVGSARADAFNEGLARVRLAFAQPARWRAVQEAGMQRDFGWAASAARYDALYRSLLRNGRQT